MHEKEKYAIHIKNLKQALNHGFIFIKVHRINEFNQKPWLKSYININTELIKMQKMIFNFFFYVNK